MTKDRKQPLSVQVPPELWARLSREADALGLTVHQHASALLTRALRDARDAEGDA